MHFVVSIRLARIIRRFKKDRFSLRESVGREKLLHNDEKQSKVPWKGRCVAEQTSLGVKAAFKAGSSPRKETRTRTVILHTPSPRPQYAQTMWVTVSN